jgi:hypothetical protein
MFILSLLEMLKGIIDIGIPNGHAEDSSRGLPKAHAPKFMKLGSPFKR